MINSIFKSAQSARSRYWYLTLWDWQSSERRQNAKAHHSQNKQLNDINLVVIKWHLLNNGHSTMSGNNDTGDHCWVKQSLAGVNRQLCPAQRDSLLSVRFRFVFVCVRIWYSWTLWTRRWDRSFGSPWKHGLLKFSDQNSVCTRRCTWDYNILAIFTWPLRPWPN